MKNDLSCWYCVLLFESLLVEVFDDLVVVVVWLFVIYDMNMGFLCDVFVCYCCYEVIIEYVCVCYLFVWIWIDVNMYVDLCCLYGFVVGFGVFEMIVMCFDFFVNYYCE